MKKQNKKTNKIKLTPRLKESLTKQAKKLLKEGKMTIEQLKKASL